MNCMKHSTFTHLEKYIEAVRPEFEEQLARLVAIPTVSADPARTSDIRRGAELARELLSNAGFSARVVPTSGHPVVVGETLQNPDWPTVTIYNHLDVQPALLSEWRTDPFTLTIDGERYVGRGATDDKGPALTALTAVKYALRQGVPLNFKIVWELEEEIGSAHFEDFLESERAALTTDSVLISDTIWITKGRPAIPYGLRGMITFEVTLTTGAQDVHSGLTGGAARNPLGELAGLISQCYNGATGRVSIPGFYDDVQALTDEEMRSFLASGFDADRFASVHKLSSMRTRDPKELLTRIWAEPTFEVHGIVGGHVGPGIKTIVPQTATAKLSTRLVPNQKPERVFKLIKQFIKKKNPDAKVTLDAKLEPYLSELVGPYSEAAKQATAFAFGVEPVFIREGGSIGAALSMKRQLNVPIVFLGLSLPEHGYHAPDEYFDWQQASGGIKLFVKYFAEIAEIKAVSSQG